MCYNDNVYGCDKYYLDLMENPEFQTIVWNMPVIIDAWLSIHDK